MQSQSGISKRQAKKQDTKDQWQAKERFEGRQRQIGHGLPFHVPAEPRIYLAIPNLNYAANSDILWYAAIRFPNCVSGDEARRLLDQVKELRDVRSTAGSFLPMY
jgi:hypothetical protein